MVLQSPGFQEESRGRRTVSVVRLPPDLIRFLTSPIPEGVRGEVVAQVLLRARRDRRLQGRRPGLRKDSPSAHH